MRRQQQATPKGTVPSTKPTGAPMTYMTSAAVLKLLTMPTHRKATSWEGRRIQLSASISHSVIWSPTAHAHPASTTDISVATKGRRHRGHAHLTSRRTFLLVWPWDPLFFRFQASRRQPAIHMSMSSATYDVQTTYSVTLKMAEMVPQHETVIHDHR